MFSAMHYIRYNEALSEEERTVLDFDIETAASSVTPVNLVAHPHEGGSNDGDIICKLGFENEGAYATAKSEQSWTDLQSILLDEARVSRVEFGAYDNGITGIENPDAKNCVHRVLMFADQERAKPEDVAMLDTLLSRFHEYVPILNWRVSTIVESSGSREWKHIWEQDFESYDIFVGPYMFTPYHPTYVDTYFDTECHNWTADPFLCTMTCDVETAFLGSYDS